MDIKEKALKAHKEWNGKIEVVSRVKIDNFDDLSLAYTPGVAYPCMEIAKNKDLVYDYTRVNNLVAVISDGSAVLGLGDIGPQASLPVMEGKCALYKAFADVDAIPIVLQTQNVDEIVNTIAMMAPSFGGLHLEDISAPRCFEIEERLKAHPLIDIPVFHDDQHGTAVVVVAGLINALKLVNKNPKDITVVVNGAGAAGCAIAKLIMQLDVDDIIMVDRKGIINPDLSDMNDAHKWFANNSNKRRLQGSLVDALPHADVFVGVSAGNILTAEMINTMQDNPIVFAMANPTPEISYEEAAKSKVAVFGTGRGDYPNQINNVLAFPGIFKGLLISRKKDVNEKMLLATAYAIANCVKDLSNTNIIPSVFDTKVVEGVIKAVIEN